MIKHIVMWKFKDGEEENTKKFLEGLNSLKNIIPEIKYMETGININPKNDWCNPDFWIWNYGRFRKI